MRTSSLASWRRNALDLMAEACQLLAALRGLSPTAQQQLEADGLRDTLAWLRETPSSPLADMVTHLDEETLLATLAGLDLPPPWHDPPDRLRERLARVEERARLALRLHTQLTEPAVGTGREVSSAATLPLREDTSRWPAPVPSPRRVSPLEAIQTRARRRLEHLLASSRPAVVGEPVAPDAKPANALPEAILVLASHRGLAWRVPALPLLNLEASAIELHAGAVRVALLASNLRSGTTLVTVPPSIEPYRLTSAEAPHELLVALVPGLDPARASAFRVRRDGSAERVLEPRLRSGERWRLMVPPALAHLSLPQDSWTLGGGWRAFELHLHDAEGSAQATLLTSLGLAPPAASVQLAWQGAAPVGYRRQPDGERLPILAAQRLPVVRVTRHQAPGKLTLLLTSEHTNVSLDLTDDAPVVALNELEPGAFCLDLVPDDPGVEPAQLSFLVARDEPRGPAATAHARLGDHEVTLGDDPQLRCTLRGDERLELTLPPLWPVRLRWRGATTRWLGRRCADTVGLLDLSPWLASLAPNLGRSSVVDLVVDAGELGRLTLQHERPFEPDATLDALWSLLQERSALFAVSDPLLLRTLWVEPVCRALGYDVSEPRRGGADEIGYQEMTILTRQEGGFEAQCYALLFVSPEPPSAGWLEQARRRTHAPRALWTDGLRWRLTEQGRRHAGENLDLVRSPGAMARASLERLVARMGV